MKNILLKVEYDGTAYNGWQTQKVKPGKNSVQSILTVQETIENCLEKILQRKIILTGSGRTDSGVHAEEQVANFKTAADINLPKIKKSLNSILPDDIKIKNVKYADPDFHARFSAKSKIYRYAILNRPYGSVFKRNYVFHCIAPLDVKLMRKEAGVLKGKHDFKSFQASDKKIRSSIRTIKKINVKKQDDLIFIEVEADGFLYNMVRNIAGTLIEIGRGKMPKGTMSRLLKIKDRTYAGPTAPACGLCLLKVKY